MPGVVNIGGPYVPQNKVIAIIGVAFAACGAVFAYRSKIATTPETLSANWKTTEEQNTFKAVREGAPESPVIVNPFYHGITDPSVLKNL